VPLTLSAYRSYGSVQTPELSIFLAIFPWNLNLEEIMSRGAGVGIYVKLNLKYTTLPQKYI
jgi:hypothetical protein